MAALKSAAALALVLGAALAFVSGLHSFLAADIEENKRRRIHTLLTAVLPSGIAAPRQSQKISAPLKNSRALEMWTTENKIAVVRAIANDGYGGDIEFLAAFNHRRELINLRVVRHRETPGIADFLDDDAMLAVDGVSGATITAAAITTAANEIAQWLWENDGSLK